MVNMIAKVFTRLRKNDKGATLVEYGVALALAITLGAGALATLGTDVGNTMTDAGNALPTAPAAPS